MARMGTVLAVHEGGEHAAEDVRLVAHGGRQGVAYERQKRKIVLGEKTTAIQNCERIMSNENRATRCGTRCDEMKSQVK